MARKIRVVDGEKSAEAVPLERVQSIAPGELVNPMPLRTKLVIIIEPIIMVLLAVFLVLTGEWDLIILVAILAVGPVTSYYQDRKIRPTKVAWDDTGVTPYLGGRAETSIPWSIVVLLPRRRASGKTGGILVQEGRRMPYLISDEIFGALTEAYNKRVGKAPW